MTFELTRAKKKDWFERKANWREREGVDSLTLNQINGKCEKRVTYLYCIENETGI